ncbi:MAG: MATE family efflux transporter [Lachnospiraceae bacterium]|nr:MATE family efflux transporter [Lachnospiraceae bacterium]
MSDRSVNLDYSNNDLIRMIWPLVLEQFLTIAVGLADSMMVAQVSDAAVSGVSLVDSISILMVYIFSAMGAGGIAVCGQYLGRANKDTSKRAGHHLIVMMFVLSAILTLLLYLFSNVILHNLFGKIDADVMAATKTYYMIVMASVPAIALYNAGAALFRAMGLTRITLRTSMLMNAINVAGNAIMIFGLKCGVEGVAIPTIISRWVAAILILGLLINKKYILNLRGFFPFKAEKLIMKNIISLGIPSGVENGMFQMGKIILYSFISTLGTASITANAIGGVVSGFHVIPGQAINLALAAVVSKCIGAGEFEKAKYYFRKLLLWAIIMTAIWAGIILLSTPLILRIYDVSPEATQMARTVCMMHGISSIVLWNFAFVTPAFLRSTGDATFTMIVSTITMWVGRVLLGILIAKYLHLGIVGVWLAHTVIDWIVRTIFFLTRYKSDKWQTKAIKQ